MGVFVFGHRKHSYPASAETTHHPSSQAIDRFPLAKFRGLEQDSHPRCWTFHSSIGSKRSRMKRRSNSRGARREKQGFSAAFPLLAALKQGAGRRGSKCRVTVLEIMCKISVTCCFRLAVSLAPPCVGEIRTNRKKSCFQNGHQIHESYCWDSRQTLLKPRVRLYPSRGQSSKALSKPPLSPPVVDTTEQQSLLAAQ